MDNEQFGSRRTGELVRIDTEDGGDWAFIPDPLDREFEVERALLPLLIKAKEALASLSGIGHVLPSASLLLTPLQNREALTSSNLEGTFATPLDLLRHASEAEEGQRRHSGESWAEVSNHSAALHEGKRALKDLPLSRRLLQSTHEVLLRGVRGRDKRPGHFRQLQVHVGYGRRFIPPPPLRMDECFSDLELFMNEEIPGLDPLVKALMVHYQFEAIHPFHDGNGRIGRVLLSLSTALWHGHDEPWLYLSPYFDRYKDAYIERLFKISADGAWGEWLEFCLRGVVQQCNRAIQLCKQLIRLQEGYKEHPELTTRQREIMGRTLSRVMFVVKDAMKWCDVTRPTATGDLERLSQLGLLRKMSWGPKTYLNHEIFELVYVKHGLTE